MPHHAKLTAALIFSLTTGAAIAEPTGNPTSLLMLRPYVGSNLIYVYPADPSPCNVTIYTLDLSTVTGKAAYAAALTAMATGKKVQLEVITQCAGTYTGLQSIYMLPN